MSSHSSLIQELALLLQKANGYLTTAESCTGGLIASYLTEEPGSSAWFDCGFVTYSNHSKQQLLSVSSSMLEEHGAVSEEVAIAMARGALKHSNAQVALSVTGIAGPSGGSPEKPVGTVCFAWAGLHNTHVSVRKQLSGTRPQIRQAAVHHALHGLLVFLKSNV